MRAAVFSSATPHVKTLAKVVSKAEADTRSKLLDSMLELAFAMKDYGVMATLLEPVFVARNGHFSTTQLEAAETFCQTVSRKKGTVSGFANQNASLAQILLLHLHSHILQIYFEAFLWLFPALMEHIGCLLHKH